MRDGDRPIIVHLRDTVTGDTREYRPDEIGWGGEHSDFIWADGNYACDCNRSLFLWDWDESKVLGCDGDRIRIRITDAETGEELYRDYNWE